MTNRDNASEVLKIYGRLLSYAKPYFGIFLLSTLGWALHSAMQVGAADIFAYVVDVAKMIITPAEGNLEKLAEGGIVARYAVAWLGQDAITHGRIIIPVVLFFLAILRGLGFLVGNYGMTYVGRSLVYDLRTSLFDQLVRLPSAYFDINMSGHLVAHMTYHVEQVTEASTNAVKTIIRDGFQVIGLLAYMLYTNWRLTAIFFVVFPFIGLIVIDISKRFRRISGRIQESMGDVTQVSQEMVAGYREVRIFGGEEYERDRMRRASQTNRRQGLKLALVEGVSSPAVQILLAIALGGLIWISLGPEVIGSMSPGQLVAFLAASGLLAKPMRALTGVNSVIQRGLAAAQSIFAMLDTAEEPDKGTVVKDNIRGQIDFRNVCFSYVKGGRPALEEVSFHVEPGEVVALVGESGSGKTTLINLIPRFYNHSEGQILLDEVDVNEYQLGNLRRHISLVTQNVTLFNDTVHHNLAYGELASASPEAVREAARQAHALDFIEALPDGFDTLIGDDGLLLSGGQRQRLAIARALLKNAPLLILDEATSALDNESERHIQAALEEVMKGRTTLIIAHRLSTIENADRILVMQQGRLVEQGPHRELLELDGRYAQLYKKQFSEISDSP